MLARIWLGIARCLAIGIAGTAAAQTLEWAARFDDVAAGRENGLSAALDPWGRLCVLTSHDYGCAFFHVNDAGEVESETRFRPGVRLLLPPVIDGAGNAYIAIDDSTQPCFAYVRLGAGEQQWTMHRLNEPDGRTISPRKLIGTSEGVYLIGVSLDANDGSRKLVIGMVESDGDVRWIERFEAASLPRLETGSYGLVCAQVDSQGNVYAGSAVADTDGSVGSDIIALSYTPTGVLRWSQRFSIDEKSSEERLGLAAMAVSSGGSVYLVGGVQLIGYVARLEPNGETSWVELIQPGDAQAYFFASEVVVNPTDQGCLFLGYYSPRMGFPDVPALFRYAADGVRIYEWQPSRGFDARSADLRCDAQGRAHVNIRGRCIQVSPDGSTNWTYSSAQITSAFLLDFADRPTFITSRDYPDTYNDALVIRLNPSGGIHDEIRLNTIVGSRDTSSHPAAVASDGASYSCGESEQYPGQGTAVIIKHAADGTELWRRRIPGNCVDPREIKLDANENPTLVCTARPSPTNATSDAVVMQYSPDGEIRWRTVYDNGGTDSAAGLAFDPLGDILVNGRRTEYGRAQTMLLKLSGQGTLIWSRGVEMTYLLTLMAVNSVGDVFLIGDEFDMLKFSSSGHLLILRHGEVGDFCTPSATDIAIDADDNVLLTGRACIDGASAMGVMKLDSQGNLLWQVDSRPSTYFSSGNQLMIDAQGEIYVAGVEQAGNATRPYLVLERYSPGGQLRWGRRFGAGAYCAGMALDQRGFVYVCEKYRLTIHRFDLDGNPLARRTYAAAGNSQSVGGMALDSEGRITISGSSSEQLTGSDILVLRYSAAPPPCAGGGSCAAGDADGDCRVDLSDLAALLVHFGTVDDAGSAPANGDLNFDGVIDLADLAQLLVALGNNCR
jgi:hypothetical protein